MALIKYTSIAFLLLSVLWLQTRNYDPSKEGILLVFGGVDPELRISVTQLDQAVTYPVQVENAKDVVLLVHETSVTPQINWESTLVASLAGKGFQPCYVEISARLFRDGQVSAEYVSHAAKKVVREHPAAANDVSIISWSASALVTQWTLTFYPETRARVKRHISFGRFLPRILVHDSSVLFQPILRGLGPEAILVEFCCDAAEIWWWHCPGPTH
ncbi:hypothetical protein SCARD494_12771 [Seiridium cardinale]